MALKEIIEVCQYHKLCEQSLYIATGDTLETHGAMFKAPVGHFGGGNVKFGLYFANEILWKPISAW